MTGAETTRLREKIQKIRRLADDRAVTDAERENAERRISEIEDRIKASEPEVSRNQFRGDHDLIVDKDGNFPFIGGDSGMPNSWRSPPGWPTKMGKMTDKEKRRGTVRTKNEVGKRGGAAVGDREPEWTMRDEWPFGWNKTVSPITEYEKDRDIVSGDVFISWKCPECGEHVTKIINGKHIARLGGQRGGLEDYVRRVLDGAMNQLCKRCWEYWDNQ